jgi:hypothetical protein
MARVDDILREAREQETIRFIDPKTPTGRRALTLQGSKFCTGNEHLLAMRGDTLYCTIEKMPDGWAARFGLQELSAVELTLDACKEMIVQRSKVRKESLAEAFITFTTGRDDLESIRGWAKTNNVNFSYSRGGEVPGFSYTLAGEPAKLKRAKDIFFDKETRILRASP